MLAAFVGCAGVGKNTVIGRLIAAYPERYEIFPTLTTREMRPGEREGDPYHYVTKEQFEALIREGEIYEYEIIHNGNYYGGSKKVLREHLKSGRTLIKDIDVLGARTYKTKLSGITRILSVFLYVEDMNTLLDRMRARGDSEENIQKRAERFPLEMDLSSDSEYMVNNDRLEDTTAAVNCLLENEVRLGGVYRPCKDCRVPSEAEISASAGNEGKAEAVELVFNGRELLIADGAARYVSAMRSGAFIQKKIKRLTDTSLKPAHISLERWTNMLRA